MNSTPTFDGMFKDFANSYLKDQPELKYPLVVCCFSLYKEALSRWPKRNVRPNGMVDYRAVYYWNRNGKLRVVKNRHISSYFDGTLLRIRKLS